MWRVLLAVLIGLAAIEAVRACDSRQYIPGHRMLGNCLLAFVKQLHCGGYVVLRRSVSNRFIPHAAWTATLMPGTELLEFTPQHRRYGWRAFLHSPLFFGRWQKVKV